MQSLYFLYFVICYALACVWFLVIDRDRGFLRDRLIATTLAPIILPLMLLMYLGLKLLDLYIDYKD